ncbi:MAG: DUF192 domain-containing protein [Candidatus Staskawiczbacteria bacterium]|nr:DUF192 domain-containing protein [Candidatus Staskawiczbacteria bacterium]
MFIQVLLLLIIVLILVFLFIYFAERLLAPATQQSSNNQVCFGLNCFSVELAKTGSERDRGLMYRKELDKDKGMLFIFDKEGIYPFWMKDTLIPLDMIWIDANKKAVFISQNVQPCLPASWAGKTLICPSVIPTATAKYVLEINAGLCQQMGLKVGDLVQISPSL